ncbi:glycosyltransferase family 4 protein [Micromonospora peucetia]|uniref:glycosyltransferase family 4 protein n=1 Tax=Micromonospora peucetia TaxID=47871 RepID=UPI002255C9D4|nr:glycosyltransferase family 4 protein [Micromonospora peucetia]MCX4385619.1 glycosyltransferase family 4 protein [Micromonospora peucetia]
MKPRNVVYLALGPHRVRAAERHLAELAASGAKVALVVPDLPEWADAELPAGVPVHRVDATDARATARAARRLLRASNGPLRDADLLVAGDPYALPAAWDALGRRGDLVVALDEPTAPSGRRPAPADLAVVTPWYPSANNALAGAFVEATIGAVRADHPRIAVLHTEDWPYRHDAPDAVAIAVAAERLAGRRVGPVVRDTGAGELTRVPVPISSRRDYAVWALAHVEAMRRTLPTGRIEAPLVHAHTGIYGGVVAQRLARPDARVVVTEHASFLAQIFAQPAARRLYEEALHRADVFLCVSRNLHEQVREAFPHHAHKLRVVPNAIDFGDFAPRTEPPRDLLRWLYVGRLSEAKGVHTLLSAFLAVAAEEPQATLTLVGAGPLVDQIRDRIAGSPYGDRVDLRPAVAPAKVPELMRTHDLLVHASPVETFGMTVVEAVACGTPVLVARSQGPQETLGGLNGRAGLLVDVSEDPAVLVEGFRELRKRVDELDLPGARAALIERYGREAVAARLREVYAAPEPAAADDVPATAAVPADTVAAAVPADTVTAVVPADMVTADAPAPPRTAEAPRVVLVAISPPQFKLVREYVDRLLDRGYAVDIITNDPRQWQRSEVDERVRLLPLDVAERRRPLLRVEQLVVYRAPGKALSVARDRARKQHAIWPEALVSRIGSTHGSLARKFHTSVFYPGYRVVRPRVLWRIVQREVLPKIDLARTERVVVAGVYGVAIGWQLGRKRPELTVTTSLVPPEPAPR